MGWEEQAQKQDFFLFFFLNSFLYCLSPGIISLEIWGDGRREISEKKYGHITQGDLL